MERIRLDVGSARPNDCEIVGDARFVGDPGTAHQVAPVTRARVGPRALRLMAVGLWLSARGTFGGTSTFDEDSILSSLMEGKPALERVHPFVTSVFAAE